MQVFKKLYHTNVGDIQSEVALYTGVIAVESDPSGHLPCFPLDCENAKREQINVSEREVNLE